MTQTTPSPQTDALSLPTPKQQTKPPSRRGWRRALRWFFRGFLGLLLIVLVVVGVTLMAMRTAPVQAWLVEQINVTLRPATDHETGIWVRLTHLAGPVPFAFETGLECYDGKGLWLRVPSLAFDWNLTALPKSVVLAMHLRDAALLRLPDTPPAPSEPPSEPLDETEVRRQLGDILRTLHTLPSWLPDVRLDAFTVENFRFPQTLLEGTLPTLPQESASLPLKNRPETQASLLSHGDMPTTRADVDVRLTAGTQGAELTSTVTLTDPTGTRFPLGSVDVSGLEASLKTALSLPDEGTHVGLTTDTGLRVQVRGVDNIRPAASGNIPALLFLGQGATVDMHCHSGMTAPADAGGIDTMQAALTSLRAKVGPLHVDGHASWDNTTRETTETGSPTPGVPSSGAWLSGNLAAAFDVVLHPLADTTPTNDGHSLPQRRESVTPLDALRTPFTLHVSASGPVTAPRITVETQCAQADAGGYALKDALVRLESAAVRWHAIMGLLNATSAEVPVVEDAASTELQLHMAAALNGQPLQADLTLFAVPAPKTNKTALLAGVRNLRGNLLGVELSGEVHSLMSLPLGAAMPGLDGKVGVRAANWKALSLLAPEMHMDGEVALALQLQSHPQSVSTTGKSMGQSATMQWHVPHLSYRDGSGVAVDVQDLHGETVLSDIWGKRHVSAHTELARVRQGDKTLNAKVRAQGSLLGSLEAHVETGGWAQSRVDAIWEPGRATVQHLEFALPSFKLGLRAAPGIAVAYDDTGVRFQNIDISFNPSGRIRTQGNLGAETLNVQLDVEKFDFAPWRTLVDALPEGTAEAHIRVAGSMASPAGNLRANVRALRMPGTKLKPLNMDLTGTLDQGRGTTGAFNLQLHLDPASVRALGGTECRVEASVPLQYHKDGPPQPAMQGPLAATVRWSGDVAPLWALVPVSDQRLAGKLAIALDVAGSLETPKAKGFVKMDKGRYEHVDLGVLFPSIALRVDIDHAGKTSLGTAKVHLDVADGKGGTVRMAGQAGLDGKQLDITTNIDHLRPLHRRDVRVELSGQVAVRGEATAPQVRGHIDVNQGAILLNRLNVGGSVDTLPVREHVPAWVGGHSHAPTATPAHHVPSAKPKPQATPVSTPAAPAGREAGSGLLDLRLRIPGRFLVEGYGLQSEWKADMRVQGTPAAPIIGGQVEAAKGKLDILGKTFKLTCGTITFGGGNVANPLLDILLTNKTATLTSNMAITGTVRKMQLTLSSDPALPRDEILARMLFGKSASELGRLENLRLAAAVAQLAGFGSGNGEGGGMLDSTRQALGMDVLRFNTSDSESSASSKSSKSNDVTAGTSVEMGKYLTEDIYVGVQQGAKQGSTAFVIQLELTPRATMEVRTEQNGTKGGLNWKYDY